MHIKKYQTKEELVYEPARLFVRVTHTPVLECENCQIYSEEGKSTYHTVTHHFLFGNQQYMQKKLQLGY
ncbi:hypothetical protein [Holdemanella porci]|uniref:hypothetical protein n=1 Tax=Holdemanella porci TaxID=2652276 RepID=UPI003AB78498